MKLAVIGCGKQGLRHLAALRGDADLTVADSDPWRARDAADRLGARLSTIDAVFSSPAIAAIIIATPTSSHAALTRRAIAAGKHVFCEKPFGGDEAAARDIADEAAARGLIGRVGYLYRLAPAIRAARAALPSLGSIDTARFVIAAPGNHAAWKHRRDDGGGVANELVSHMIDLALWFFGSMRDCTVLEQQQTHPRRTIVGAAVAADADDRVAARLISQSGVTIDRGETEMARLVAALTAQAGPVAGKRVALMTLRSAASNRRFLRIGAALAAAGARVAAFDTDIGVPAAAPAAGRPPWLITFPIR